MSNKKVVVAGSINMDIVTNVQKHPQVGETVIGKDLHYYPGGKGANQAVASSKQKTETYMLGQIGKDSAGEELISFLKSQGVNTSLIQEIKEQPTGTALITVGENSNNSIVVVPGANGLFELSEKCKQIIESEDILVSQFEIPANTIESFFEYGRSKNTTNILNVAPANKMSHNLKNLVDILVVNETELAFLANTEEITSHSEMITEAKKILTNPQQSIVITLGSSGILLVDKFDSHYIEAHKVEAVDTTGAGDCFTGVFASQLSKGQNMIQALEHANKAASICVQRPGAGPSMPTIEEVAI